MRKVLIGAVLSVAGAVAAAVPPADATSATPSVLLLAPATKQVPVGSTFVEKVKLRPNGVYDNGVEADLRFPANLMSCTSYRVNTAAWPFPGPYTCNATTADFSAFIPGQGRDTGSIVFYVKFTALAPGQGSIGFLPSSGAATDQGVDTLGRTRGSVVTITAAG